MGVCPSRSSGGARAGVESGDVSNITSTLVEVPRFDDVRQEDALRRRVDVQCRALVAGSSASVRMFSSLHIAEMVAYLLHLQDITHLRVVLPTLSLHYSKVFICRFLERIPVQAQIHDLIRQFGAQGITRNVRSVTLEQIAAKLVRNKDAAHEMDANYCTVFGAMLGIASTDSRRAACLLRALIEFEMLEARFTIGFVLDDVYASIRNRLRTSLCTFFSTYGTVEGLCNAGFFHEDFAAFRQRNYAAICAGLDENFRQHILRIRAAGHRVTQRAFCQHWDGEVLAVSNEMDPGEQANVLIRRAHDEAAGLRPSDLPVSLLVGYSGILPDSETLRDDDDRCSYLCQLEVQLSIAPLFGCMELPDLLQCHSVVNSMGAYVNEEHHQTIPSFLDMLMAAKDKRNLVWPSVNYRL